jgi:hypothetical protein
MLTRGPGEMAEYQENGDSGSKDGVLMKTVLQHVLGKTLVPQYTYDKK